MMTNDADCPSLGRNMIDCEAAVRMLWDYLDGNLSSTDVAAVQAHVDRCAHCFSHADFGQVVLDAIAQARRVPESLADAPMRDRVLARLRDAGYSGPGSLSVPDRSDPEPG